MRWREGRRSENIEDRRGMGMPSAVRIGGGGGLGIIVIALIAMLFGVNPLTLLESLEQPSSSLPSGQPRVGGGNDEIRDFVSVVLADTEDVWTEVFRQAGHTYRPPRLVLFSGMVQSACGMAQAAVGPFYCPADQKVYLDLSFFDELRARFRAPGDFAQAYVIAHEIAHHVQTLLGISQKVHNMRERAPRGQANQMSVRLELQADCLAGLWAHKAQRARQILEAGDIEEGLNAASAIGDDRMQRRSQGQVVPESFTHGSSAQRLQWFRRGLEHGDLSLCNTFQTNVG
jgi:predicted metalloprotease